MFEFENLLIKPLLFVLRGLWFLCFELWFDYIGWFIGWHVVRLVTFGHYPKEKLNSYNDRDTSFIHCMVSIVGLATLGVSIYLLAKLV